MRRSWPKIKINPNDLVPSQPPADLVEVFDDVEQGSDGWHELRMGIPTASVFGAIMAQSEERKMRERLLDRLAAEQMMRRPMETWSNAAMARGIVMEPAALEHYAFTRNVELKRVGFVRRTIFRAFPFDTEPLVVGCSPDSLVGDEGLLQTKTMQPDLIVGLVKSGRAPTEHRWQCQGEMWVTGRKWVDLKVFYQGFALSPVFRMTRDQAAIDRLAQEADRFDYDLRQLVKAMKDRI